MNQKIQNIIILKHKKIMLVLIIIKLLQRLVLKI